MTVTISQLSQYSRLTITTGDEIPIDECNVCNSPAVGEENQPIDIHISQERKKKEKILTITSLRENVIVDR